MPWGEGSTRATRRTRDYVLNRDQHQCQLRYDGCTGKATEAHHIHGLQGRRRRDATDPTEMVAACPACHAPVTEAQRRTAWEAKQRYRNARRRLPTQPHPGDR